MEGFKIRPAELVIAIATTGKQAAKTLLLVSKSQWHVWMNTELKEYNS